MDSDTFARFLERNKTRFVERDRARLAIFEPDAAVEVQHIETAERQLGLALPASYKTFLLECGSGLWCGDYVAPPEGVYSFDEDCGDMEGFLPLVHNVRGAGNFVAMNPREPTAAGEWALYYCSHDPFGFGRIADSFESWTREAVAAFETNADLYKKAADDVDRTWRSLRAKNKSRWQFWK